MKWLLAVAAAACAFAAEPQGLRQVWELKLRQFAANEQLAPQDVLALRYSPNGEQIAAVVSRITGEGEGNEVLLIPASGSAGTVRHLRFREPLHSDAEHPGIHWSPDGDYLAVEFLKSATRLVKVADEAQCELPRTAVFGGFLSPSLAVAADFETPKDPASVGIDSSTVTLYGLDCKVADTWRVPGQVRELEASPAAGLMALTAEHSGIRIMRRASALATARVPENPGNMQRFGEKGTVLCTGEYGSRGSLVCTEIDSGRRFANPMLIGGSPFDVSLDSSVVLATQSSYAASPDPDHRDYSAWIIWNYRTGHELGRLRYQKQKHGFAVSPSAIAPDGRRFVVAVRGAIRMYEISAE